MASAMEYPIHTKGIAVYSEDPRDYICYICPEMQNESLEHHLKDKNHLMRFKIFNQSIVNMASVVYDKMTSKPIDFGKIVESALADVPEEEATDILFKNYVSKRGNQYFCELCKVKLPFWPAVESHSKCIEHQALRIERIDDSILQKSSFSIFYKELVVKNSIFMKSVESMFCYSCGTDVGPSFKEILNHIQTRRHFEQKQIDALGLGRVFCEPEHSGESKNSGNCLDEVEELTRAKREVEDVISSCIEFKPSISDDNGLDEDFEYVMVHGADGIVGENDKDFISEETNSFSANVVTEEVDGAAKVVPSSKVPNVIEQIPKEHQNLPKWIIQSDDKKFTCSVCECHSMPDLKCVKQHVNGAKHHKNIPKLPKGIIHGEDEKYSCLVCGVHNMPNLKSLEQHVNGAKHHKNIPKFPKGIVQGEDEKYSCSVCGVHSMPNLKSLEQHVNGAKHQKNIPQLPKGIIQGDNDEYSCSVCKCYKMASLETVKQHVNGSKHLKNVPPFPKEIIHLQGTSYTCSLCHCQINGETSVTKHVEGTRHREATVLQLQALQAKKSKQRGNKKIVPKLSSSSSTLSLNSLQNKGHTGYTFEGIVEIKDHNLISCAICDNHVFPLPNDGVKGHLNGKTHRNNLAKVLGKL